MQKPTPVPVSTVCSVCGLDWERHGAEPSIETCVRLLREELATRPSRVVTPNTYPGVYPWPVTTPVPNTWQQGGCAACSRSGICNCVNPPGAVKITCNASLSSTGDPVSIRNAVDAAFREADSVLSAALR